VVGNPEASLTDQLAGLLEAQQEDALARAREPLSSLFDYYLETTREDGGTDEAQAGEKDAQADENRDTVTAFSDLLEIAARAVDQTIADMVKNAFDNTLKSII